MLNNSNDGGDWKEHSVAKSQIYKRNAKTGTGSETIWEYMKGLIDENVAKGSIRDA